LKSIDIVASEKYSENRFVSLAKRSTLPPRRDPGYADALRTLHSAILGICALIESVPYSVEPWMPSLTEGGRALLIYRSFE